MKPRSGHFYCCVVFLCRNMPYLPYASHYGWIVGLFPVRTIVNGASEHFCAHILSCFNDRFNYMPSNQLERITSSPYTGLKLTGVSHSPSQHLILQIMCQELKNFPLGSTVVQH